MGRPSIVNDKTKQAARLVAELYEVHPAGGGGHIVFDDFNIEDNNVNWCIKWVMDHPSGDDGDVMRALLAFEKSTEDERASALAIYKGWV